MGGTGVPVFFRPSLVRQGGENLSAKSDHDQQPWTQDPSLRQRGIVFLAGDCKRRLAEHVHARGTRVSDSNLERLNFNKMSLWNKTERRAAAERSEPSGRAKRAGEPAQRRWSQRAGYDVLRVVARLAGVTLFQLRCRGREHYPAAGGGLVCANHQSFLDPVLVGLSCDRRLNYLARKSLFGFAPFRWLIEFLDAIPIDRDGFGVEGIKETLRRLKRGELVLIFPEGTRTPDGEVQPLKPGFCAIARRCRVPLIPVAIEGAYDAWPRALPIPRPTKICIVIGEPISPEQVKKMDDQTLVEVLESRIRQCHRQARGARNGHA